MRTEQHPSQLWAEPLPEPKPNTVQQPAELYLSPDSTLCAVSYCHLSLAAGTGRVDMGGPRTHGLAVYETYTGKQKQILRTADSSGYNLVKWSPCGSQLTVYCEGSQHIDFIDVASGSSNSMPWIPSVSSLTADSVSAPHFSPDGHLFVARRWDTTSAALDVLRVADFSLLASSELVDLGDDDYDTHAVNCYAEWMWHPSSKGLIIAGCSWQLLDPAAFHAAGLSVGHCPEPAHLTGADFSPSGHMLLTPGQEDSRPARRRSGFHKFSQYAVVKCTEQAQAYSFEVVHIIGSTDADQMPTAWWCPVQQADDALLISQGTGLRLISAYGEPLGMPSPLDFGIWGSQPFSPCGTLCCVMSTSGTRTRHVLHCQSGAVYRVPECNKDQASWRGGRLFWPASGSCIMETAPNRSLPREGGLRPFSLLVY